MLLTEQAGSVSVSDVNERSVQQQHSTYNRMAINGPVVNTESTHQQSSSNVDPSLMV